ncbi:MULTISPECIES: A/G-specific adenine glycosylase [unclassified Psychrobacillus]|uniref:A/G-specific adenine glycosylase n=1 Tax=unclassified Psychrobacillus TaxID=2636677 RepID=UPI00124461FD|nr:A/G-specific adenine glycosylase [Psychrobacillus sp. AK 1817]QEY22242.1 A/G-specific adenine glycosylase [Psychrobacillus sp. AK 1817]
MNELYNKQIGESLVSWFLEEKRDLPWRKTKDPYKIWVSEVMLQQTKVDTVIPYYERFISKYPSLESLAEAEEGELLKEWEGLGYYSRARNLQAGVREVVEEYNSVVPNNRKEISKLKGVGPYTAGAVLSIAYDIPEHAVDGNVMRVLSRILLIKEDIAKQKTKKIFEEAVMNLMFKDNPSAFNQGLMELGAIICTPTKPKCLLCPVREYCSAFYEGVQEELPIKTINKKTKLHKMKAVVIQRNDGKILLEKRPSKGLLANMWQFPMVELPTSTHTVEEVVELDYGVEIQKGKELIAFKHIFSHLVWEIESFEAKLMNEKKISLNSQWYSIEEVNNQPMPIPVLKMWNAWKERKSIT